MTDTIYCPNCKTEIKDVNKFLGYCDKCIDIDDESWKVKQQFEKLEQEERVMQTSEWGQARKELWARVFSLAFDKQGAYKLMDKLVKKIGAWSVNDMTIDQLHQAYSLTNSIQK